MRPATVAFVAVAWAACMTQAHAQDSDMVDLCDAQSGGESSFPARCCESLCGLQCEENLLETQCSLTYAAASSETECSCEMPWQTSVQIGIFVWLLNIIIACIFASCMVLRHLTSSHPIDPTPETITSLFTLSILFGVLGLPLGRCLMSYQLRVMRKRGLTTDSTSSAAIRGSRSDSSQASNDLQSPQPQNRVQRTESTSPHRPAPLPPVPTAVLIDPPTIDTASVALRSPSFDTVRSPTLSPVRSPSHQGVRSPNYNPVRSPTFDPQLV